MDSSLNPLTVRVAHASDRTPMTEVTLPQSATVADLVAAVRNCADLAAVEPSAHRRTIARILLPTPPPLPLAEIAPADFEWATTLLTAVGVVDGGTVYAHVCDTAADVALANDRYTADTINAAAKAASEATRRLAGAILADLGTVSREEAAARAVIAAEEAKAAEVEAYSDGLVSLHQSSIIDRLAVRRADLMPLDAVGDGGEEEENGDPNFGGNGSGDHHFGIHGDEGPLTCSRPLAITNNSNEPRWLPLPNVRVRSGQFCAVEMSVAVVPAPVAVAAPPGVTPAEMAARAAAAAHRSLSGLAVEYASTPKPKNANEGVNVNDDGAVAADAAFLAAATAKTRAVLLGRCVHTAGGDPVAPHRKAQPAMYGNIPFNAGQFASNFAYTVTTTTVSPAPPTPPPATPEGAPLAGDAAEAADANAGATAVASPAGAGQQRDEEDEVKGQVRQKRFVEDVEVSIDVKHAEPGASRRLSLVVDRTAVRSAPIVKAFCGREARNGAYTRIYSGPVAPSAALAAGNRRGHSSSAPSLSSSAASFLRGGLSTARSCNAKAAKIDDDGAFSFSVCVAPMTTVRVEHVLFAHEAAIPDGFRE